MKTNDTQEARYKEYRTRSEVFKAVSEAVVKSREALGLTATEYAKRLGIARATYNKLVHSGMPISRELARRIVGVHHGETFEDRARIRYTPRMTDYRRQTIWMHHEMQDQLRTKAAALNMTPSGVVVLAVERFLTDALPAVTIRKLAQEIRDAELVATFAQNPWLQATLELEPEVAKNEATKEPRAPEETFPEPSVRTLLRELQPNDIEGQAGPAYPIYLEESSLDEDGWDM
ncbi:MAG: helix-turn-helix transcriptional regulator [Cyanobacteria bacterium J06635_11]